MSAYYSSELKCWVRMEKQEDGEYCHTSGFDSYDAAMGIDFNKMNVPLWDTNGMPTFLAYN